MHQSNGGSILIDGHISASFCLTVFGHATDAGSRSLDAVELSASDTNLSPPTECSTYRNSR